MIDVEDWRDAAACKGRTHLMFDLAWTPTAEMMCSRCPVRAECEAEVADVRPAAGRWAGQVYDREASPLGIRGRVQWQVYDALITHSPIVDPDGKAMVALAELCGTSLSSTTTACRRMRSLGLLDYDASKRYGTHRIELQETSA